MRNKICIKSLLADEMNISKAEADKFIKSYANIIKNELIRNGAIKMPGVGTLRVKIRSARKGYNPSTKNSMIIPAYLNIGLSVTDSLKRNVNLLSDFENLKK